MNKTNKTTVIKQGSKWSGTDGRVFVVLDVVEADGHTWVHYRSNSGTPQEYSCYQESFESRFRPLPE